MKKPPLFVTDFLGQGASAVFHGAPFGQRQPPRSIFWSCYLFLNV